VTGETSSRDERLKDLPPSCRYVLDALEEADDGTLTRRELGDQLCHCERTITDALNTLENRGYIPRTQKSGDFREVAVELAGTRTYNPSRN
jgi:DNA-binding MarR family transcriptional regulator